MSADRLRFDGIDLLQASPRDRRKLRGGRMSMILQDPKFSLNPVLKVGRQIMEAFRIGYPALSGAETRRRAIDMLEADEGTQVIALISKPPAPAVAEKVLARVRASVHTVADFSKIEG